MEEITQPRGAVGAATIAEAFRITAADRADEVAVRTKGDEIAWTWGELRERVDALAAGLAGLGLERGDTVALLFGNRPEFHLSDLAVVTAGGTPFSIYMQYGPEQIRYVVTDAGARMIMTEQQFLANVLEARKELPDLEHVIVIDGEAPEGVLTLDEVVAAPDPDFDVEASVAQLGPQDLLTIIYTSGTTGPPKGVQLSHRNLLAAVEQAEQLIDFPPDGRVISWLPAAHVAERNAHHYLPIVYGLQITCCDNPREILGYLPEVRPLVVLRGPAHLGEAQGGPRGDGRRPARRAARQDAGRGARRAARRSASSRPARRSPPTSPRASRRPTARSSPACARCSASTRSRRSTSARRRRRSRCSSSSTPSGCRWPSCGG